MQSFLITGPAPKTNEYVLDFLKKQRINAIDISFVESEKAVSISQIREFQKKIYLKPYKSDEKAVILNAENGITQEAQNALLKVLEEPPADTLILLLSGSLDAILPTIISRCKIINLSEKGNDVDLKKFEETLLSVNGFGIGERLKIAEANSKDKEQALSFLKGMLYASEKLLKEGHFEFMEASKFLQETYREVKNTNTNLRLTMEHLLLNLHTV